MIDYVKGDYGFWRQIDPAPITYDEQYKSVQKTTTEMSWLRLGVLISTVDKPLTELRDWWVCDVGSGNGKFAEEARKVFGHVCEYDLSGTSISEEELYTREWDAIFLTDVLEHYPDINDLFKIDFKYLFLSFPECPEVCDWRALEGWRHYRPNEHIWMLNSTGVQEWLKSRGYKIQYSGNPEDIIRTNPNVPVNISTIICSRT